MNANGFSLEEQIKRYREELRLNPGSDCFVLLAEAHLTAANPAEALEVCRTGLAFSPDLTAGRLVLAKALCRLGRLREAEGELAALVALDPEQEEAQELLAQLQAGQSVTLDIRRGSAAKRPAEVNLDFDPDGFDDKTRGDLAPPPPDAFLSGDPNGKTIGLRTPRTTKATTPPPDFEEGATLKGPELSEMLGEKPRAEAAKSALIRDELSISIDMDPDEEEEATRQVSEFSSASEAELSWGERSKLIREGQGGLADLFQPRGAKGKSALKSSGAPDLKLPKLPSPKAAEEPIPEPASPPVKRQTQMVPRVKSAPLIEVVTAPPKPSVNPSASTIPAATPEDSGSLEMISPPKPFSTAPLPIVKPKSPIELIEDAPAARSQTPLSKELPSLAARGDEGRSVVTRGPASREVPALPPRGSTREVPTPEPPRLNSGPAAALMSPPSGHMPSSADLPSISLSPLTTNSSQPALSAAQLPVHLGRSPSGGGARRWLLLGGGAFLLLLVVGAFFFFRAQRSDEAAAHLSSFDVLVSQGSYAGLNSAAEELRRAESGADEAELLPRAALLDGLRLLYFGEEQIAALGDTLARAKDAGLRDERLSFGAVVFASRGELSRALRRAEEERQAHPKSGLLAAATGALLVQSGDAAGARNAYEEAVTLSPELRWGRMGLAELLAGSERGALSSVLGKGDLGPRGAALSLVAAELGSASDEASAAAERGLAATTAPREQAWLRVALARRAYLARDDKASEEHLAALGALAPGSLHPSASLLLGELLLARGQGSKAREALGVAQTLFGAAPTALLRAEAELVSGDAEAGLAALAGQESGAAQVLRARASLARGEAAAASKLLGGAAAGRPEAELYAVVALLSQGDAKAAEAKFAKLPALARALPQGYSAALPELLRAEIAQALSRPGDATAALERAKATNPNDEEVARRASRLGRAGGW